MDLGLAGKAYCIVGGSRGVGLELVRTLAAERADVAIVARTVEPDAAEWRRLEQAHGVRIHATAGDVTRSGDAERAIGAAAHALGRLDGLAVTTHGHAQSAPFVEMDDGEWQRQFTEVLLGPVRCVRAALPLLIGGGAIVLTGAYSARAAGGAITGYAAMKAAIVNLTKGLAKAHGRDGIRVNAVCPGFVATERAETRMDAILRDSGGERREAERALLAQVGMTVALDRLAAPGEIADMIAFLLSARSGYTTGLIANIDGGTDF